MSEMQTVISYLKRIDDKADRMDQRLIFVEKQMVDLREEVSSEFTELHEEMDRRFAELHEEMDRRFEEVHEEMETLEFALQTEIYKVYRLAKTNQKNIEQLLLPFNDRNLHMTKEVEKIPKMEERQDAVEQTVQSHSVKIRKLEESIA